MYFTALKTTEDKENALKFKASSAMFNRLLRLCIFMFFIFIFFYFSSHGAKAATATWTNGGGNNAWTTCTNWSGGTGTSGCPGAADVATFNNTNTTNVTIAAGSAISVLGVNIASTYSGTITQTTTATLTVGTSGWTQAAGTFTGGSGSISISGNYSLTSGAFTSTSGTLTMTGGTWSISGGTFTHNSGSITFNVADNTTQTITGSINYNNVTFDTTACCNFTQIAISSGTVMTINGTMTISANYVNTGFSSTGEIDAKGNITFSSNVYGLTSGNAAIGFQTVKLVINGTGSQTITGVTTSTGGFLPSTTIDKSSGTLSLVNNIRIGGNFNYLQGTVSPGSSTVIFSVALPDNNVTVSGSLTLNNVTISDESSNYNNRSLTVASGTTITVTGNLLISLAGTDTGVTLQLLGPGTLLVAGNYTETVLTPSLAIDGTLPITLNGSGAQTITQTNSGGNTYAVIGTLTINKPSGTATLASNYSLPGTGQDLTITSGTLNMSTFTLTVNDQLSIGGTLKQTTGNIVLTAGSMTVTSTGNYVNSSTGDITIIGGQSITNNGYVRLDGTAVGCGDATDAIAITRASGASQVTLSGSGRWRLFDVTLGTNSAFTASPSLTFFSSTIGTGQTSITNNSTCPSNETTWKGTTNSSWNTTTNWSGGAVPTASVIAVFDATGLVDSSIDANASVLGMQINLGYANTITQTSTFTLTIAASGYEQNAGAYVGGNGVITMITTGASSKYTQTAGTFTGGAGNITIGVATTVGTGGSFSVSGGTFTAGSGILEVRNDFTVNGTGTFTASTGTLVIDPVVDNTATVTAIASVNNFKFTDNGNCSIISTLASTSVFTVAGTLTLDNGCNYSNFLIGSGQINAQGNISVSKDGLDGTSTSPLILINGTGSQTITTVAGGANYAWMPKVTINKSSGTLTISNTISITEDFTYIAGTIAGSGGIKFWPNADGAMTITGSVTLPNVTFYNQANGCQLGTVTISSGTTITSSGTLTLDSIGTGCQDLTVNGPGTVAGQGNFLIGPTRGSSGDIAITLNGSLSQTITKSGTNFPTGTFTISKSSGTVTLASAFSLSTSGQDLIFTSGTFNLSTFALTVNDVFEIGGTLVQTTANVTSGTYQIDSGGRWTNGSTGDIIVGSGGVTNNGYISFGVEATCGSTDNISITSSSSGVARTWSGRGSYNLYDITVQDQTESPVKGRTVAYSSVNNGNSNFNIVSACPGRSIAKWKLDESSGTTVNDSTGNSNTGTLAGATLPAWKTNDLCISNSCLYFNGSTSSVTVATTVANVESISMWVKPISITTGALIDLNGTARITFASGVLSATGFTSPIFYVNGIATTTIAANKWQHVEVTTSTPLSGSAIKIGNYSTTFLNGFIDEVSIYGYVRTQSQVNYDYIGITIGKSNIKSLSDGLVGYWKMDESSWNNNCSTLSVLDSSGNANNAKSCPASTGPTGGTIGKFGSAGTFDGTDDYVAIPASTSLNNTSFSAGGWYKFNSVAADQQIINKGSYSNAWRLFMRTDGRFEFDAKSDSINLLQPAATITAGTWNHIFVTFDATNNKMSIYTNGTQSIGVIVSGDIGNASNTNVLIGVNTSINASYFGGSADEIRFYNKTLSPKEISNLYNFGPAPVGAWDFEEGTGSTVKDTSGNGATGTWNGTGTRWTNGKVGNAGIFNGTDDYVNVPTYSVLQNMQVKTIETWINPKSLGASNDGRILQKGYWVLQLTPTNKLTFKQSYSTTYGAWNTPSSSINLNSWVYVTVIYDKSSLSNNPLMYLNGIPQTVTVNQAPVGTVNDDSAFDLTIGSDGFTLNYDGKIDGVKIYNYARTQAQIIEDMDGGQSAPESGADKSAIANWKFDEGNGTTANDSSSNNKSLTLSASTWNNTGKFNKAWDGNGTNWLSRADDDDLDFAAADNFSISMWFKSDNATNPAATEYLLSKTRSAATQNAGYAIYAKTTGVVCFGIDDDTTWTPDDEACNTSDIYDGTWHQITATKTGTTRIDIFIDGVKSGSDTSISATGTLANTRILYLGDRDGVDNGDEFNGDLDEVKIYKYQLNDDQVKVSLNESSAAGISFPKVNVNGNSEYCVPGSSDTCTTPVAEWNFEEKAGLTLKDSSGNNNNGTFPSSITWSKGKIGSGLQFDGANSSYVTVPTSSSLNFGTGSFTYQAWVYEDSSITSSDMVLNKGGSSIGTVGYDFEFGSGAWNANLADTSTRLNASFGNETSFVNHWVFVSAVVDRTGNTLKAYTNGVLAATTDISTLTGTLTNSLDLGIGGRTNNSFFFKGRIDQVKIYNYARTASQVAWDYNKGGAVAWYKMDDCQGTSIKDSSGNAIAGTLTIGALGTQTAVGNCTTNASTAWYNGRSGKRNYSLNFDGNDDKLSIGNPSTINDLGPLTLSAWIYPNSSGKNGQGTIFAKDTALTSGFLHFRFNDSGTNGLMFSKDYSSGDVLYRTVDNILTLNTWQFVTVTWDGTTNSNNVHIYVNGIEVKYSATQTGSGTKNSDAALTMYIGNRGDSGSTFDGKIDEAKIFNYVLTPAQINTEYNGGALKFGQ